jgi:mitogen-activated protein kinase 15
MTKNIDPHILKQFKIAELMGSGAYGHVWRVESKQNGKKFALKKVFGAFRNSVDAQRTYR